MTEQELAGMIWNIGYMLANPPFGVDWKKIEGKVKDDASKSDGRFSVGLPSIPMKEDIEEYIKREVLPFVPDAWRDPSKDKIGCEFPLTRLFYR